VAEFAEGRHNMVAGDGVAWWTGAYYGWVTKFKAYLVGGRLDWQIGLGLGEGGGFELQVGTSSCYPSEIITDKTMRRRYMSDTPRTSGLAVFCLKTCA